MNSIKSIKSRLKELIIFFFLFSGVIFLGFSSMCHAKEITLKWDPNHPSDNIEYYRVYYDDIAGPPYDGKGLYSNGVIIASGFQVGDGVTATISGLSDDKTYYFVVTAVSNDGLESDYSNEAMTRYSTGYN